MAKPHSKAGHGERGRTADESTLATREASGGEEAMKQEKNPEKTDDNVYHRLFPIPQDAIDGASNVAGYLKQNEGY